VDVVPKRHVPSLFGAAPNTYCVFRCGIETQRPLNPNDATRRVLVWRVT